MAAGLSEHTIKEAVNRWSHTKRVRAVQNFVRQYRDKYRMKDTFDPPLVKKVESKGIWTAKDLIDAYKNYGFVPDEIQQKQKAFPAQRQRPFPQFRGSKPVQRRKIRVDSAVAAHTKGAYSELCETLKYENTMASLKVIAAANGLMGFSKMRKDELCAAIASVV